MTRKLLHTIRLIALLGLLSGVASCYTDNYREVCDYKVQLRYDYNEENTSGGRNMIEYYVYTIDEYIFDEAGILFDYRRITPDRCREMMNSEWNLPPGRYSVIAVGNQDERSRAWDAATMGAPVKGQTRRDDMRLDLVNAEQFAGSTCGPSEPLYHGYRTFTVKERGISRIRVDMVNAHFTLKFRVKWLNNATPPTGEYYALLESVPSEYDLMPEYIYPAGSFVCRAHNSGTDDLYPSMSYDVIHHIPHTCFQQDNILIHRNDTRVNVDKEMWGEFRSYRMKDATAPVLRIFSVGSAGMSDVQIVRDIDLQTYFDWYEYHLDTQLKQAYEIDITIDGDRIIMVPLNVADYEEGGVITGTGS